MTPCERCGQPHPRCRAHTTSGPDRGRPCRKAPSPGAKVCRAHGGAAPQVAAHAAMRAEISRFGFTGQRVDVSETMLDLVAMSARRVTLYAGILEAQYDAAKGADAGAVATPGVAALIGHRYGITRDGDRLPIGEATRGMAALEAEERDRCAKYCAMAMAAGIAERAVRLAERQAELIVTVLTAAVDRAGLPPATRLTVLTEAAGLLEEIGGTAA